MSSIPSLLTVVNYRCAVYTKGTYNISLPLHIFPASSSRWLRLRVLDLHNLLTGCLQCFCPDFACSGGKFCVQLFCFRIKEERSWGLSFCPGVLPIGTSVGSSVLLSFSSAQIICYGCHRESSRLVFECSEYIGIVYIWNKPSLFIMAINKLKK